MQNTEQINFDAITPEELANILSQLFKPDTEAIKKATGILKQYFKQVKALENLLILMSTSQDTNIRQISCVYLRKIIRNLWGNLNQDQQVKTKTLLLERFVAEPVTLVKKNIADVVGSLGMILIPNKEWDELFAFVFQYTQSENLSDKELAMILLSVIMEYFTVNEFNTYYEQLNVIIENYLKSDTPSLKTLAIEAVNNMAQSPSSIKILKKYTSLVPLVLNAIDMNQEDLIQKVFETLTEFLEFKKLLAPHLLLLIKAAINISTNTELNNNLREITIHFLEIIGDNYSKYLVKKNHMDVIEEIIKAGFIIASESTEDLADEDESLHQYSLYMLFNYAVEVPNDIVYPIFMKYVQLYGKSANEFERKASVKVLGQICDSDACLDLIKDDIDDITGFLVTCMNDQSVIVRESTAQVVGMFSEACVPEFLDQHEQMMPCILNSLKQLSQSAAQQISIEKALFALDGFVQNMQDEIKPYLNDCIAAVVLFIQGADYKKGTRYWALNALGSIVLCAEKKILPFQEDLLKLIFNIIQSETMEQEVKGQALSCAGHIAASCGKEQFPKEALEVFTKFGMECLCGEKKQYELRETALSYFSEISKILKNDMAPIFDKVLEQIVATCKSEEGIKSTTDKKDKFSLDSDSEEEEIVGIDVNTNFIDEKSSAIHCLGNMAMNCIDLMLPRMDLVLSELREMSTYFHENIRYHVCLSYTQIAFGLLRHYTGQDKLNWKKGLPVMVPLPDKVQEFLRQVVYPHYFKIFNDESNKEVIEKTLECVRDLADELGPGAVAEHVEGIMSTLIDLLDKKAFCQMGGKDAVAAMAEDDDEDEEEDEDEDDEDLDHDEIILGNVTDVIISLSKVFGDSFAEALAKLGPKMVPYLSDEHPKSDRLMVIGCFAEVFNNCPAALPVYFNDYIAILLNNSKTKDSGLNRNCAYSFGVLAEKNGELFKPKAKEAAQAVHMMHQNSDEDAAKDNCIAALCRILASHHTEFEAADNDAMFNQIFTSIPFSGDANENETILKFTMNVNTQSPDKLLPHMEKITLTCLKVLTDDSCDEIEESFKNLVGKFIKNVVMNSGEAQVQQLQAFEGQMSAAEKDQLAKYLNSQ